MPIEIKNLQFIFIKPQNPYLAVSRDNQHFITLTEMEVKDCAVVAGDRSCFIQIPIFTKNYQIFNSINLTELPKQCIVEHQIFDDNCFKKLSNGNKFIYWVSKVTTITFSMPSHYHTPFPTRGRNFNNPRHLCIIYANNNINTNKNN